MSQFYTFYKKKRVIDIEYSGTYSVVKLGAGSYKFELWGASGGGDFSHAGKGGYSTCKVHIKTPTTYYMYVGGQGSESTTENASGGFNGGGKGYLGSREKAKNCGGGGSTDIRTSESYNDVIVVAGGGGGGHARSDGIGGYGGGKTGGNGTSPVVSQYPGTGGTQTSGGSYGYYESVHGPVGSKGTGAYANGLSYSSSGSGSGYFGGGSSYESTGAGGSGFISNSVSGSMKSGNQCFLSPNGTNEDGHYGNGYIRVTPLDVFSCKFRQRSSLLSLMMITLIIKR